MNRKQERIEHVWRKAFLWALYRPGYSALQVEVGVGDTYKPDVVAMDARRDRPRFWGEAGHVGPEKIAALVDRYDNSHLAIAKGDTALDPVLETVEADVHDVDRLAPIDLPRVPPGSGERLIDGKGHVSVTWSDVTWIRVGNAVAWS